MRRTVLLALPALLGAAPVLAQPLGVTHAEGWVAEDGRIVRDGDPRPVPGSIHPATAGDWIGECQHRLGAANHMGPPDGRFEEVCRAWLDYYERTGQTAQGYGFAYAIPVALTITRVPGDCPPPPAPPPPRPHRPVVHDKRVKTFRY